jgi:hypothetical protein
MFLVDLDKSYQNILKSRHIAWKKVVLSWGTFSDFGYLKGVTGAIRIANKKFCINYDRLSQKLSEYK